jgi:hypothetical protein
VKIHSLHLQALKVSLIRLLNKRININILSETSLDVEQTRWVPVAAWSVLGVADGRTASSYGAATTRGCPTAWGSGVGLTTIQCKKKKLITKSLKRPRTWTDSFDKHSGIPKKILLLINLCYFYHYVKLTILITCISSCTIPLRVSCKTVVAYRN